MSDVAATPPTWELKRRVGPGSYRMYAHGYFAPTWSLTIFMRKGPRTIIGRKRIDRAWAAASVRSVGDPDA